LSFDEERYLDPGKGVIFS